MTSEKELFDLVNEIGETLDGKIHVINMSEEYPCYKTDKKYRVYHQDGYCIDVECMTYFEEEDLKEENPKFEYNFYSEWDNFKKIKDAEHAICLIK